ncbi:phage tail protein [Salmonella enterica subsp. enterica serovar Newport]|nr:phage tail protein [Salmonella enterica subsp. enterica serovar Newport]
MPQLKGVIKTPTGEPLGGATITLTSLHNRAGMLKSVFSHVTTQSGEYDFPVLPGVYSVRLTQSAQRLSEIGVIRVYEDSGDGSLNDFLGATDIDLRPEALKKFETLAQQAQQSAEKAGEHANAAEQARRDTETLAGEIRQDAEAIAGNVQKAEKLASETAQNAARAEQAAKDADKAVDRAVDKLGEAATLTGEAKASAEAAARSEQNAKGHADNAAGSAQQTAQDVTAATTARQDAERFANEAEKSAQASGTARDKSVDAAESARRYHNAASSAATSAELSANTARGHANTATEQARRAKESQDASAGNAQEAKQYRDEAQQIVDGLNATNATTTEKGLVQLCSATDNDSEALAATPKAVKTVMDEVKDKAPLNSPALAGTPTTPTPDLSATGREIANAAFVRALIAALVGSVPETLDTLKELADALGNDPNFATTMTNALAGKQPLSDVLTSLSSLPATGNKVPYFSDKNVMALANLTAVGRELTGQNSKGEVLDYLGLKGAATKDVQTDIYDRTPERVAMPGAFGYGAFFRTIKMFSADKGPSEFLLWVRSNPPGQYAVSQYGGNGYKPILEGVVFNGIVEIKIPGTVASNESHHIKDKLVIFYGSNGEVYHNRLIVNSISGDRFRGWRNWLLGTDGIANTLSSLRGSGYGYPDIGGVVLAAYCGTSDTDSSRKFYRGVRVPGSRLAVISVTAACNTGGPYASTPQVVVASPGLSPMAGTFTALSGLPGNSGGATTAMIGLFVRTA